MKCRRVGVSLAVVMALILTALSSLEAFAQGPAKVQVIIPSIYYSGHTAGDPAGTTEPEALIKQGSDVHFNSASRWGDYSSMALDGADGCTFWYTTEFCPASGSFA